MQILQFTCHCSCPDSLALPTNRSAEVIHEHVLGGQELGKRTQAILGANLSPNGKVATSIRRSGSARSGAFAERVIDDHVITDQDVESFLCASSRHLHGDHVALSMG